MTAIASKFEGLVALSFPGKGMSEEEFFEFCQLNRDLRIERTSKGEIIIMSPTGTETGNWNFLISTELGIWNKKYKLGRAFDSSTGFKLPTGATYGPDAAWMPNEKWNALSQEERRKFAPVVPDFIMELRSPNDNIKPIEAKISEFMECGCQLAWLIDPAKQQTTVYRADSNVAKVPFDEFVTGEAVLPGFEVKLSELFQ